MNNSFNKWPRFLSSAFAIVGLLIGLLICGITDFGPFARIIGLAASAAISLLSGYLGLELELWLNRKKFAVVGRKSIAFGIIASLVVGLVLGTVGQTLYCLETKEYTEEKIIEGETTTKANIVLMLDASASMSTIIGSYVDATVQLIDGLDENTNLQFGVFSDLLINKDTDATEMLSMTDANKKAVKDFIANINHTGFGTNFNIPIDFAVDSLMNCDNKDNRSVIVLLTDCEGDLDQTTIDNFKNNNCELYAITIKDEYNYSDQLQKTADKFFELDVNSDGTINVSDAVDALKEAVVGEETQTVTKTKLSFGTDLIGGYGDKTFFRAILTIVFYGIFSVAAGIIYYGFGDIKKILLNYLIGAACGLVGIIVPFLGYLLLAAAGLGDFTKYEVTEDQGNV